MNTQLSDILNQFVSQRLEDVHTAIPGTIQEYTPSEKRASVKPMLKTKFKNTEYDYPVITGVPVVFPGSAKAQISFPLEKGDGCLILVSERSLDEYMDSGRAELPGDPRKFSLTDAICIPGLFSFSSPGVPGSEDGIQISYNGMLITLEDSGNISIEGGGNITLNGDSKTFVTHAELDSALQTFISSLNAHTHPTPSGPSSAPTVPLTLNISSAATTTVKTGG